jgi:hypothetical protein
MTRRARLLAAGLLCAASLSAWADPWLAPGDEGLRSDILRLADAGILRGPVTTWPLSWPDISRDALAADERGLDDATADALLRIQRLARSASATGYSGAGYRVGGASDPTPFRSFAESPREQGELSARGSWLGEHVSLNLQGTYAADASDGKEFRADGSYLGVNIGNFMVSAGLMERWWGPGWDSSLILSTNARPIPTLTLERNYTDAFKTKLLSWLGPWRASIAVGEAETHDIAVPGVRFFAARVNFKPRPWLEFGLSRTAQMCGGERTCNLDTLVDMLLGRDNDVVGEAETPTDTQPGNQMAGYDLRLRSPWRALPVAFHTQWIGEDEAGGLPSRFIGQFGLETWGSSPLGGWRVRAEYTDTACNFLRNEPEYRCAYIHSLYPQGYAYRGRTIGNPMHNDSRMMTVAGQLTRSDGSHLSLSLRRIELNRDGGPHPLIGVRADLDNVELRYSRPFSVGNLSLGVGYLDPVLPSHTSSRIQGFAVWQQGF